MGSGQRTVGHGKRTGSGLTGHRGADEEKSIGLGVCNVLLCKIVLNSLQ